LVKDIDKIEWKGPPADNIRAGVHTAECVGSNINEYFEKLYLHFQIAENRPDNGKTTFRAYNIPRDGRISTSSNYYKDWTRLTGRRPSKNNVRMSPRFFHGHLYKVRIESKHLQNNDGEPVCSADHEYGLVTDMLEEVENPSSS
jgi:hypothetical protein